MVAEAGRDRRRTSRQGVQGREPVAMTTSRSFDVGTLRSRASWRLSGCRRAVSRPMLDPVRAGTAGRTDTTSETSADVRGSRILTVRRRGSARTSIRACVCMDVPTRLRRISLTGEVIRSATRTDNVAGLEFELNLHVLLPEHTGGWVSSRFDVVDQLGPRRGPMRARRKTGSCDASRFVTEPGVNV